MEQFNQNFLEKITQQLYSAGIDISKYGVDKAKKMSDLAHEIESGESTLIEENGELIRKVLVGGVDVYYQTPDGKKYILKEDKQVFEDGRERKRKLQQSMAEKIKPNEDPAEATERGIVEELGISGKIELQKIRIDEEINESPSYPGLKTKYVFHRFAFYMTEEQFKPEGYIEKQSDKETHFIWQEI